jgi:hypothetical protein
MGFGGLAALRFELGQHIKPPSLLDKLRNTPKVRLVKGYD